MAETHKYTAGLEQRLARINYSDDRGEYCARSRPDDDDDDNRSEGRKTG